jgi:hypothetical protein
MKVPLTLRREMSYRYANAPTREVGGTITFPARIVAIGRGRTFVIGYRPVS